eukprot:jgi/Bigna1/135500/aug1.29_g10208
MYGLMKCVPITGRRPLKKALEEALDKLKKKDRHKFFHYPVDKGEVPQYYDIILKPMDFNTMKTRKRTENTKTGRTFRQISSLSSKIAQRSTLRALQLKRGSKKVFEDLKAEAEQEPEVAVEAARPSSKSRKSTGGASDSKPSEEKRRRRAARYASARYVLTRRKNELYAESCGGLLADGLHMGSSPTIMDLITMWHREETLRKWGLPPFTQRVGNSVEGAKIGPIFYNQYRPFRDQPFVDQFKYRVERFTQGLPECMRKSTPASTLFVITQYGSKPYENLSTSSNDKSGVSAGIVSSSGDASVKVEASSDAKPPPPPPSSSSRGNKEITVFGVRISDVEKLLAGHNIANAVEEARRRREAEIRAAAEAAAKAKAKREAAVAAHRAAEEARKKAEVNKHSQQ